LDYPTYPNIRKGLPNTNYQTKQVTNKMQTYETSCRLLYKMSDYTMQDVVVIDQNAELNKWKILTST